MTATVKKSERVYASETQLRYLREGLDRLDGKLPLFDENGEVISKTTIMAVVAKGWAEPAYAKTFLKGLEIFKLTDKGREVVASLTAA